MSEQKSIHQLLKESSSSNEGFQHESSSSVVVMGDVVKTTRIIPNNLSLRTNPYSPGKATAGANNDSYEYFQLFQMQTMHSSRIHIRRLVQY